MKYTLAIFIGLTCFSLYFNSIFNDYVLDDFSAIKENFVTKQGVASIPLILKTPYRYGFWSNKDNLYRPLPLITFAIEWQFLPDNPLVSHLVNVLLYSLCGVLLYMVLYKLLKSKNYIVPFICSILFAAHPVHTEVVANIKSRDEILSLLFLLVSLLTVFKYLEKKSILLFFVSLLCYFLSLLSKESAITFLAIIPLFAWFFKESKMKEQLYLFISFSIVTALYVFIRFLVLQSIIFEEPVALINNSLAGSNFAVRSATSILILGKYLFLLLFPISLSFDYSFNQIALTDWTNCLVWLSLSFYIFILIYAVLRLVKKDLFSISIFIYLLPLTIVSNLFFLIESSMAERFLFIPSIGFCLALSLFLSKIFNTENTYLHTDRLTVFVSSNKKILLTVLLIFICFSAKTVSRNWDWKNNETLFSNDLMISTKSAKIHYLIGNELIKNLAEKENDTVKKKIILMKGIGFLQEAISIFPAYSDAQNQIGVAYFKMKNYEKALLFFLEAQTYDNKNAEVKNNIGCIYFETGQKDKAKDMFGEALAINPNFIDALRNLGSVCAETGKYDEALKCFLKAINLDSKNRTLYYYAGMVYHLKGDEKNANIYLNKTGQALE